MCFSRCCSRYRAGIALVIPVRRTGPGAVPVVPAVKRTGTGACGIQDVPTGNTAATGAEGAPFPPLKELVPEVPAVFAGTGRARCVPRYRSSSHVCPPAAKRSAASRTGFEPVRGNPIGFRVQRLNHSATVTLAPPSAALRIDPAPPPSPPRPFGARCPVLGA